MKDIGREMSVPHFELWEDGRRIPDARQPRHVVPWRRIFLRRVTDPRNINKHKGRECDGFEIDLMRSASREARFKGTMRHFTD